MRLKRLIDKSMRVLACRDHSEAELRRKMTVILQRSQLSPLDDVVTMPIDEEIDQVISWCYQHNFLDDSRYTKGFISLSARKGYGPLRIKMELNRKGIDRSLIDQTLADYDIDWTVCAAELVSRRYDHLRQLDSKEIAKLKRYLLTRGFFIEHIQGIFRNFDN